MTNQNLEARTEEGAFGCITSAISTFCLGGGIYACSCDHKNAGAIAILTGMFGLVHAAESFYKSYKSRDTQ